MSIGLPGYAAWSWLARTVRNTWRQPPWVRGKWLVQRARRGYSDADVYHLFSWLQPLIAGAVRQVASDLHGMPDGCKSAGEWRAILASRYEPLELDPDQHWPGETARERRERQAFQAQAIRVAPGTRLRARLAN